MASYYQVCSRDSGDPVRRCVPSSLHFLVGSVGTDSARMTHGSTRISGVRVVAPVVWDIQLCRLCGVWMSRADWRIRIQRRGCSRVGWLSRPVRGESRRGIKAALVGENSLPGARWTGGCGAMGYLFPGTPVRDGFLGLLARRTRTRGATEDARARHRRKEYS